MVENIKNNKFEETIIQEFKKREAIGFQGMDFVTFPSKAAMELFVNDTNINTVFNKKTKIIYNGIDFKEIKNINPEGIFEKYRIQSKDFDIILLNNKAYVKPKNIQLILKATKILLEQFNLKCYL
ncbi:MAG: hypothetical protein MZV64_67075 [Ignavibacteriales bacterium]|nr:hypothetical protein [Ignavibacteriales bacterium]